MGGAPDADWLARVEETFHAAMECDAGERAAVLEQRCAGDERLRREVEALIEAEGSEGVLEIPAIELAAPFLEGEPVELRPGVRMGPYQIVKRIGVGGMGEVYLARDERLERMVALKSVHAHFSEHALREARAIAALNHPNICTLHDIGPDYLILEYVEGQTLAERVAKGALGAVEVRSLGGQIADALWCAHSRGVVHGDLKPRNLMLTRTGVKVLDFGLARVREEGGAKDAGPALATPAYSAPEQLTGGPVDARTDVFALGLVLYEMATGRRAFGTANRELLRDSILKEMPDLALVGDPGLAHVIERCLAKDPEDRWQTARDVKLELDHLARVKPEAPGKAVSRFRWAAAAAAVVALAAAAIGWQLARRPAEVQVTPLTSYPGSELEPSFSPDGSRVAFSWDGSRQENRDIYVRQIGPGNPVRLTHDAAEDVMPRWSPDGQWIAFLRIEAGKKAGVYVVPALGGKERRVGGSAELAVDWGCLDWTRDSQWLVVSAQEAGQAAGLVLVSVETGVQRRLTQPPPGHPDLAAQFSPNGKRLAFLRKGSGLMVAGLSAELAVLGEPEAIQAEVSGPVQTFAWTADGRELVVSAGYQQGASLWRVGVSGQTPQRLAFGDSAVDVAVSAAGGRLAFVKRESESHIWEIEVDGGGRASRVFESSRSELSPAYSPDGTKVAFSSNRSGTNEIWVCERRTGECWQVTSMKGTHSGSPKWSPDGRWIVFDVSRVDGWEIEVVAAAGGTPRRLAAGIMPQWSQDGKRIYYRSGASDQMYSVTVAAGGVKRLGEGFAPQESPDGRWLYYLSKRAGGGLQFQLMRRQVGDDSAEAEALPVESGLNFLVTLGGVWFLPPGRGRLSNTLSYHDFATGSTRVVYESASPLWAGLSISPDGRRLLVTQVERGPSLDLMLAEGFR